MEKKIILTTASSLESFTKELKEYFNFIFTFRVSNLARGTSTCDLHPVTHDHFPYPQKEAFTDTNIIFRGASKLISQESTCFP